MTPFKFDDLLDKYPNAQPLSAGGQKVVFRLECAGQPLVIKIGKYSSSSSLERIRREVQVLQRLDSPYFPKVYEFHEETEQRFVIVEECLDGSPLSDRLRDFSSAERAINLVRQLVEGLSLLWSDRIIHRDIKPQNLIVLRNDQLRIIDLGIARLLDETSLTKTHAPWGPCTPAYASPEQLMNKKRELDHRSDQFQCGIVFAQLLLGGRHPYDPALVGEGQSIPENILNGRWARSHVGGSTESTACFVVIERLLGQQPHERYRLPSDLTDAIHALQEEQ